MPKKQSQEEFIKKAKAIFGDEYDYSKVKYKNSSTPVIVICKKHGKFKVKPGAHLCYKTRCEFCSGKKHNKKTFVEKAKTIHGNKFIYSKVKFKSAKIPVIIICRIHGDFKQTPDSHINKGSGCIFCNKSYPKTLKYFLSEAKKIHGDKYDYSKVNFHLMSDKVEIICKKHGSFFPPATLHINKHHTGCPKCHTDGTRTTQEEFLQKCIKMHGNRFDYSKSKYKNAKTEIEIICKKHGSFWQLPYSHIGGTTCPKCVGRVSKKEIQWLNYIKIPEKYRNKRIVSGKKYYKVDAYDPETNTIYEFYGDYWHGNPSIYDETYINKHNRNKFKDLYKKTIKRQKELESLGYKVIFIWENDFDKIINKNKIKRKSGRPKGSKNKQKR